MEGVVNVLKPPGMTSSDAVTDLRRIFGMKRVGHLGTLDPGAAGVLPICIGRATRLFDYLVEKEKEYLAEICFGVSTDTQDSYGARMETSDRQVTLEQLREVLPEFLGEIQQLPPMYSALKVNGQKLCDLARGGATVERQARKAWIYKLEVRDVSGTNRFLLQVRCSKGTYVRTLCHDIGLRLGVPAHLSFLLRTASGAFRLENTFSIPELKMLSQQNQLEKALVSCEAALSHLPEVHAHPAYRQRLLNGCTISADAFEGPVQQEPVRVYCDGFLGVGLQTEEGLHMRLMLGEEER